MNEILSQRKILASKLKKDVENLYDTLRQVEIDKFNISSKYIWKRVYTGYTDRVSIFIKRKFLIRSILIYDIEDDSCYERVVQNQDHRILEAIREANDWIQGETEMIKRKIKDFSSNYYETQRDIQETIKAYSSLKGVDYED